MQFMENHAITVLWKGKISYWTSTDRLCFMKNLISLCSEVFESQMTNKEFPVYSEYTKYLPRYVAGNKEWKGLTIKQCQTGIRK